MEEIQLTEKQQLFCIEYLKDFNATQSAIRAGYSEDSAKQIGSENLSKPYLRKHIDSLIEETLNATKTELRKQVIDEIKTIAFDTGELITDSKGETIGVRNADKIKALELLGKYATLFENKTTVDLNVNTPVQIIIEGVKPETTDS